MNNIKIKLTLSNSFIFLLVSIKEYKSLHPAPIFTRSQSWVIDKKEEYIMLWLTLLFIVILAIWISDSDCPTCGDLKKSCGCDKND